MRRFDLASPVDANEVHRLARALDALWCRPGMLKVDNDYLSIAQMRAMLRFWRGNEMWPEKLLKTEFVMVYKNIAPRGPEPSVAQMEAINGYWKRDSVKIGKLYHTVVKIAGLDGKAQLLVTLARKRRVVRWLEE